MVKKNKISDFKVDASSYHLRENSYHYNVRGLAKSKVFVFEFLLSFLLFSSIFYVFLPLSEIAEIPITGRVIFSTLISMISLFIFLKAAFFFGFKIKIQQWIKQKFYLSSLLLGLLVFVFFSSFDFFLNSRFYLRQESVDRLNKIFPTTIIRILLQIERNHGLQQSATVNESPLAVGRKEPVVQIATSSSGDMPNEKHQNTNRDKVREQRTPAHAQLIIKKGNRVLRIWSYKKFRTSDGTYKHGWRSLLFEKPSIYYFEDGSYVFFDGATVHSLSESIAISIEDRDADVFMDNNGILHKNRFVPTFD